jgi:hypothetical protein
VSRLYAAIAIASCCCAWRLVLEGVRILLVLRRLVGKEFTTTSTALLDEVEQNEKAHNSSESEDTGGDADFGVGGESLEAIFHTVRLLDSCKGLRLLPLYGSVDGESCVQWVR